MLTLPVSEIDDVVLALKAAGVCVVDASGRSPDQVCERVVVMGGETQAAVVMGVIKTVRPGQSWQIEYSHRTTTESLSVATSVWSPASSATARKVRA